MRHINLTRGFVAIVDDEDYERVSQFRWKANINHRTVYATRRAPRVKGQKRGDIKLHHFILGTKERTDHHDGNGLNNQRYNLRPATMIQNNRNARKRKGASSRWKGVHWSKKGRCWRARIGTDGKVSLGSFRDECNAAQAYNFAAEEMYGEFARFNTPGGCL